MDPRKTAACSQLKKLTNDYYLHLLDTFREMLNGCFAMESDGDTISLSEDADYTSEYIRSYNNFIQNYWNLLKTTQNSPDQMRILLLEEKRETEEQKTIDQIKRILPLHNATVSPQKLQTTLEKLKAVASLRMSILENRDNDEDSVRNYSRQLQKCHNSIEKHRNPDWDKFYNVVSILPFIGIPRALYSFFTRGTWDFTLSEGEVMCNKANDQLNRCA